MPVRGMFDEYLGVPNTQQTRRPVVTNTTTNTMRPRDLMDAAETNMFVQADPVDKTYEGDNRPAYIKNNTNITVDQYNEFLGELDDLVAQANLNYRQEQLNQRIIDEAQGRQYDPNYNRNIANQARQEELFVQQTDALLDKYGVPRTFTTDAGSIYRFNPNGKYTKTYDAGMDFGDWAKVLTKAAISAAFTAGLGGAIGATTSLTTGQASALASTLTAGAQSGWDPKQMLSAAVTSGMDLDFANEFVNGAIKGVTGSLIAGGSVEDALKAGLTGGVIAYGVDRFITSNLDAGARWDPERGALIGPDGTIIGDQSQFKVTYGGEASVDQLRQAQQNLQRLANNFNGDVVKAIQAYDNPFGLDINAMTTLISMPVDIGDYGLDKGDKGDTELTADTPAGDLEEVVVTGEYDPNYHGYAPSGLTDRGFTVNPIRGNDGDILRYVYVATDANGNETLVVSPDYYAKGGDNYGLSERELANFLANYQLGNAAYSSFGVDTPFPEGFNPFDFKSNASQIDRFDVDGFNADGVDITKPEYSIAGDQPALPITNLDDLTIEIEFDPMAPEFDFTVDFQELPQDIQEQIQQIYDIAFVNAMGGGGGGGGSSAQEAANIANQAVKQFLDSQGLTKTTTDTQEVDSDGDGTPDNQDFAPDDPSIFEDTTQSMFDSDGDGIIDSEDAFPDDPLNGETDTDGDGMPDSMDGDIDGDGVMNEDDFDPLNKDISVDPSAVDPQDTWFNQAGTDQINSANALWSRIQDAISANNLVEAASLLNQYANLTGGENAPPNFSYVPVSGGDTTGNVDGGDSTKGSPDGGGDTTGTTTGGTITGTTTTGGNTTGGTTTGGSTTGSTTTGGTTTGDTTTGGSTTGGTTTGGTDGGTDTGGGAGDGSGTDGGTGGGTGGGFGDGVGDGTGDGSGNGTGTGGGTDVVSHLLSQPGAIRTPEKIDPTEIDYLYDFSSIFATPEQEMLFPSPYAMMRGRARQRTEPKPPLKMAQGGKVMSLYDINEALLKLLGD